jgi:hypothetical protein
MIAVECQGLRLEWTLEESDFEGDPDWLRFHTLEPTEDRGSWPDGWAEVDDGSYCTNVTPALPLSELAALSVTILVRLAAARSCGTFKREAEGLSWSDDSGVRDTYAVGGADDPNFHRELRP